VSFDVFFQGFIAGESSEDGGREMAAVLAPHVTSREGDLRRIRYGDGEADVYLSDDGMLANHVTGRDPWSLLVRGAQAANWVILPSDCPTCLTSPGQREDLPEGLGSEVVVIETGDELLAVIEAS
jgi:hypothetical protein